MSAERFVIFAHSGDYDRLYQVATLAASAAAVGEEVHIILFFEALRRFIEDRLDEAALPASYGEQARRVEEGMRRARAHGVSELIDAARQAGRVVLYACAAQMRFYGYTAADAEGIVDEVIGLPEFLRRMKGAGTKLFI